jgi:hypothetical protein
MSDMDFNKAKRVRVDDDASVMPPIGEVARELIYGDPKKVALLASSIIQSYEHLVLSCSLKESNRRIGLMRKALAADPESYGYGPEAEEDEAEDLEQATREVHAQFDALLKDTPRKYGEPATSPVGRGKP